MRDFISAIWGDLGSDLWGELRCIRNGAVHQQFFRGDDIEALVEAAADMDAQGWDSYYGVMPRMSQSGRADDCVPMTSVLWQDVDSKHLDGTKMAALLALGKSPVSPSIVVDSGNGMHSYHLLQKPVPFVVAAQAMRGMAKAIGGDAVYDAPRVLRLPGTSNHKSDPPHPVRLLCFEPDRRVRFSDFSDYLPDPVQPRTVVRGEPQAYASLPDWLRELIEEPADKGFRSGIIFKAMLWLIRYGWSKGDIVDLLYDFPEGFGEKVAEMKPHQAERWIDRTFDKALERAQEAA